MKKLSLLVFVGIIGLLSISSCKKKDDPTPAASSNNTTPPALSVNSKEQTTFSLDGTAISYIDGNPDFSAGYSSSNTPQPISPSNISKFNYGSSSGLSSGVGIIINKGEILLPGGGNDPGDSAFYAFFVPATVAYSPGAVNGVYINYWDGTTQWKTDLGLADQTGSTFKIIERKDVTTIFDYTVKIYATFNCKLYDGNGNVKTLTNGVFIGSFAKI